MKDILQHYLLVGLLLLLQQRAGITTNAISQIFLNNDGSGYTSIPTVTFSDPPYGGIRATAVAITTSIANVQSILRLEITNGGSGYITPPTITISGGGGTGAAATCSIGGTEFSVSILLVLQMPDLGYACAPIVTLSGSPGCGVTATAIASNESEIKLTL